MQEKDILQAFSHNLKTARKAAGLTQRQVAEALGYSAKAVSKWESGESAAPTVLLPELSSLLGISIDTLLQIYREPIYYLGIDGGGTKTEFVLADQGGIKGRLLLGPCNPNDIGINETIALLKQGIDTLRGEIPREQISVYAGIAGCGLESNSRKIIDALSLCRFAHFDCGSDAKNAIAASLGEQDGIMTIAGTGTVTFVQKEGELSRLGGFNYLFDEGGSGYALGRDALLCALKNEEVNQTTSSLYKLIIKKCGKDTVWDYLPALYTGGKKEIASYAPLVFTAGEMGDPQALEILERNAVSLAQQIKRGADKLTVSPVTAVLVGGLTNNADFVNMIKTHLNGDIHLRVYADSLCNGALRLAGWKENSHA